MQDVSARVLQLNPETIEYDEFVSKVEEASVSAIGRESNYICRVKRQFVCSLCPIL